VLKFGFWGLATYEGNPREVASEGGFERFLGESVQRFLPARIKVPKTYSG